MPLGLVKVKVKGHGFRIYGTNEYVAIFGSYSVNRRSIPGYINIDTLGQF